MRQRPLPVRYVGVMCEEIDAAAVSEFLRDLPMKIWAERERRHISQAWAASEIGIDQQAFTRYELGRHSPNTKRLIVLLDWLERSQKLPAPTRLARSYRTRF